MTFLRAWLLLLVGLAFALAVTGLTWIIGTAVDRLTGSPVAGFVVSVLLLSLVVAWLMTLSWNDRVTAWIVRAWTPPRS